MEITAKGIALLALLWPTSYTLIYYASPMGIGKTIVLWILLWQLYAVTLRGACHVCKENAPSWRDSIGIMLGVALVGGLLSYMLQFILLFTFGTVFGVVLAVFEFVLAAVLRPEQGQAVAAYVEEFAVYLTVGMPLALLIASGFYAAMIPGVTFGKGILLYLVQCIMVLVIVTSIFLGYSAVRDFS